MPCVYDRILITFLSDVSLHYIEQLEYIETIHIIISNITS